MSASVGLGKNFSSDYEYDYDDEIRHFRANGPSRTDTKNS